MRVAALVCALTLLVSPYFFAYCEVERLLVGRRPSTAGLTPGFRSYDPSSVAHHHRPALDLSLFVDRNYRL